MTSIRIYWPEGDFVSVTCPYCGVVNSVEIAVSREMESNVRPVYCEGCGRGDFDVEATPEGLVVSGVTFSVDNPE